MIKAGEDLQKLKEEAEAEAQKIVEDARAQAACILEDARTQAEAQKADVLEQARRQGQQEAKAEADRTEAQRTAEYQSSLETCTRKLRLSSVFLIVEDIR